MKKLYAIALGLLLATACAPSEPSSSDPVAETPVAPSEPVAPCQPQADYDALIAQQADLSVSIIATEQSIVTSQAAIDSNTAWLAAHPTANQNAITAHQNNLATAQSDLATYQALLTQQQAELANVDEQITALPVCL